MIRRFGEPPRTGQRYGFRPGVYVILPRDGMLLVTWQGGEIGELQLPGGGIDPGEGSLQALHREVMEETGWVIGGARRIGAHRRFTYMPDYNKHAEKMCHVYVARPIYQVAEPSEPDHTALWVTPEFAVENLATPGDAALLARLIAR